MTRFMRVSTACIALAASLPAQAQSVEEFYRGKTITMVVGTGENGGAVETYPRALAQVMKKHLPGSPNIIVSNMPGAGGIKAANYIYSIAPQDGTVWGFITRGFLLAPMLKIPQANFDPVKFNWIGSTARTVSVGIAWKESTPVRTIQDAMAQQMVLGATSAGQDTAVFPNALNKFIGTKFKVVTGYSSVGEVDYAMEKGEVQGKLGFTWAALNSGRQLEWLKAGKVQVLVQLGVVKAPNIPAYVPLALDLAPTPGARQALEVIAAPSATGFPSFMGPGVPKERIDAIRAAYVKSLADPEFIEHVRRQSLDIDPIAGEDLAKIVRDIYALPQDAVEQARTVMPNL